MPHLRIDSHVVIQLGAELISDSEQALLELVKNAYDADASKCVIMLEPDWAPDTDDEWADYFTEHAKSSRAHGRKQVRVPGRIVVADDGDGINESGVENGWLYISASLKRAPTGNKSLTKRKNRTPVGDKGLGRLATMRLGEVLRLRTITANERNSRTVSFAWSSFATGAPLEEVPVLARTGEKLAGRAHGTNIEILGLLEPDYWTTEANVNALISKLSSLISPFRQFKDFRVHVRSGGQEHDLQAMSSEALNFASSKFEFSYSDGKLRLCAFFAKSLFRGQAGHANRQLFDELLSDKNLDRVMAALKAHTRVQGRNFRDLRQEEGGWLFSLEDEIDWDDIPREPKLVGAVDPGPLDGEIYNFLFNDQTKELLHGANVPLELLRGMTTIGMYRDGFRVRMSDDWLDLAKGVTSGGFFQLRPRNVIGYFAISNKSNPLLVEKSDREGFVDNEAWRGFMTVANRTKKFANDSLDAVRTAFDDYKKQSTRVGNAATPPPLSDAGVDISERGHQAEQSLQTLLQRSEDLAEKISIAKRSAANLGSANSPRNVSRLVEHLGTIEDDLEEVRGKVEAASVATRLGFSIAGDLVISHEQLQERNLRLLDAAAIGLSARSLVHEINTHLTQLSRALQAINSANRARPNERIERAASGISDVLRELKKSVAAINPLIPGSRTLKDEILVFEGVKEFIDQRASRLEASGVTVEFKGQAGLKIRFSKARFIQILENLFQNSLYWISEHQSDAPQSEKKIYIGVDQSGLTWSDSGRGVRPAVENSLFEPYVSDKPEAKGQGLGLFIVNSYLQAEKCSIALLQERNKFERRYIFRVDLSGAKRR